MKPKIPLSPDPNEAHLQALIVEGLRFLGYTVLVTSRRRGCGPDGADRGVPDLIVTKADGAWPTACACLIEVKGPRTRLSREQADLLLLGRIVVVRSFDEARNAVEKFERGLSHHGPGPHGGQSTEARRTP